MRWSVVSLGLVLGCGRPVESVALPDVPRFDACAAAEVDGLPCERGWDCMVACECPGGPPISAGNCLGNACEPAAVACEPACAGAGAEFSGRTCPFEDTG